MNIMNSLRTSLSVRRLSNLLFIKCNGPPVSKFDPKQYVELWLRQNHVSADDSKARATCDDEPSAQQWSFNIHSSLEKDN
jgi:hypothetical protein